MGTLKGFPNPPAIGSGGQSPPTPYALLAAGAPPPSNDGRKPLVSICYGRVSDLFSRATWLSQTFPLLAGMKKLTATALISLFFSVTASAQQPAPPPPAPPTEAPAVP